MYTISMPDTVALNQSSSTFHFSLDHFSLSFHVYHSPLYLISPYSPKKLLFVKWISVMSFDSGK